MTSDEKARLRKTLREFQQVACADAKAPVRIKAVNTLLNSGYNLRILDDSDIEQLWESLFFALWYAEMGRGCEEIIASIERACRGSYRLTKIGLLTISKMWYGLDQYRIDKVSHLARHLLPILLEQQIKLWFKCRQQSRPETQGVHYEISKTLTRIYDQLKITTGKFELKANLIVFLYNQIIDLASNIKLDARLLRTFDQYVIKKFVTEILPNESQLTQILVSLRLYQSLDMHTKNKKKPLSGKCNALLKRWSEIIQDIHEDCINGHFFPSTILPTSSTIKWTPHIK